MICLCRRALGPILVTVYGHEVGGGDGYRKVSVGEAGVGRSIAGARRSEAGAADHKVGVGDFDVTVGDDDVTIGDREVMVGNHDGVTETSISQ